MQIPKGILIWIFVSNVIVCIDAFFILNRPETLKGGKYFHIFHLYQHYYKFDTLYDLNSDPFVVLQSWLNLTEALVAFLGCFLCLSASATKKALGALVCFTVSVMVFWKTVIFVWYDRDWLSPAALNFQPEALLCYYFPNSFWIVFPLLSIYLIGKTFVYNLADNSTKPEKIKNV